MPTAAKKAAASKPKADTEQAEKPAAKKRTVLTPEQKISKLEADLAAAREAAVAKRQAKVDDLNKAKAKLEDKINADRLKLAGIEAEVLRLSDPMVAGDPMDDADSDKE
jgi:hypothetical protein